MLLTHVSGNTSVPSPNQSVNDTGNAWLSAIGSVKGNDVSHIRARVVVDAHVLLAVALKADSSRLFHQSRSLVHGWNDGTLRK